MILHENAASFEFHVSTFSVFDLAFCISCGHRRTREVGLLTFHANTGNWRNARDLSRSAVTMIENYHFTISARINWILYPVNQYWMVRVQNWRTLNGRF